MKKIICLKFFKKKNRKEKLTSKKLYDKYKKFLWKTYAKKKITEAITKKNQKKYFTKFWIKKINKTNIFTIKTLIKKYREKE